MAIDYSKFADRYAQNVEEKKNPGAPSYSQSTAVSTKEPSQGVFSKLAALGAGVARSAVKNTVSTFVQFPRAFVAGAAGLAGNQQLEERFSKPVNAPFLGEIKGLSANPYDTEKYGTKTAAETAGQAVDIGASLVGAGAAGGVAKQTIKGALGQAAKIGAKQGAKAGLLGGIASGLEGEDPTARSVVSSGLKGAATGAALGAAIPVAGMTAKGAYNTAKAVKNTISPDKLTNALSAIKPGVNNKAFKSDLELVWNTLEPDEMSKVGNLNDALSIVNSKKSNLWSEVQQTIKKGSDEGLTVDGSLASKKIRTLLDNPKMQRENPGLIQALEQKAKAYEGDIGVDEAERIIEQTNAELASYYRKNNIGRAEAYKADPQIAADIELADSLRSQLDDILEKATGAGVKDLKRQYGALKNVSKEISQRIPIAERQNLSSLSEQLTAAQAAGDFAESALNMQMGSAMKGAAKYAMSRILKNRDSSDAKIARAFSQAAKDRMTKK